MCTYITEEDMAVTGVQCESVASMNSLYTDVRTSEVAVQCSGR